MNRTTGTIRAGLMAVLAALLGCGTPVEHGTMMTPQQISSDLVGKAWSGKLYNGSPTTWVVNSDGTARIEGGLNDSGHWRMSDKGYCVTWNRMRQGKEGCYIVERTPSGHYVVRREGKLIMTVTGVEQADNFIAVAGGRPTTQAGARGHAQPADDRPKLTPEDEKRLAQQRTDKPGEQSRRSGQATEKATAPPEYRSTAPRPPTAAVTGPLPLTGVTYDPLRNCFRLSRDPAVNYMLFATRG